MKAEGPAYDATELVKSAGTSTFDNILIDQGDNDEFYTAADGALQPSVFVDACKSASLIYIPSQTHTFLPLFCLIPPLLCLFHLLSVPNVPSPHIFFVSNHPPSRCWSEGHAPIAARFRS